MGAMLNADKRFLATMTSGNDLPQEFTDKAIVPFCNRLWLCVAAAGGHLEHCLNTHWAADIHHWNIWTVDRKLCIEVWFIIHEHIQCATARSFEEVNFKV